jgi:hypothetical protein
MVIGTIRQLATEGPVTIVHYGAVVTWRQLSYYFPANYVIHAPEQPGDNSYAVLDNRVVHPPVSTKAGKIVLVPGGRLKPTELIAKGVHSTTTP